MVLTTAWAAQAFDLVTDEEWDAAFDSPDVNATVAELTAAYLLDGPIEDSSEDLHFFAFMCAD
jgi:hypothetical protein